jgi:6-pyruvoyltetrahydropterin/6-carboxytetrahydropterin synthase
MNQPLENSEGRTHLYELKVVSSIAAAHRLRGIEGKCEELHGHNWKVEVFVTGEELGADGLLIDFKWSKRATAKVLQELDHKFLNELDAFEGLNPSSENLARHIHESLRKQLNQENISVSKVTVWESDTAAATFEPT